MNIAELNKNIVDGYLGLLENLSPSNKLDLISKLTSSIKSDLKRKKSSFREAYGAFESSESAEEIIEDIRNSRNFNRQIESF